MTSTKRHIARLAFAASLLALASPTVLGQSGSERRDHFAVSDVPRESWQGVARRLAASLVDPAARAAEGPLFLPGVRVNRFGDERPMSPGDLRDRFEGMTVLSVAATHFDPRDGDLAGTLSDDARLARDRGAIPASVATMLAAPPEGQAAAEAALCRWLVERVEAATDEPVAVIALWDAAATGPSGRGDAERLTFVLLKGSRLPDGRLRFSRVAFGTAAEATGGAE